MCIRDRLSTKLADDTSKAVERVYSFTSSPTTPATNILVPSWLKARPTGAVSWEATLKLSTKVGAASALVNKRFD